MPSLFSHLTGRPAARLALCLAGLGVGAVPAQAQTSYTLSVLKPPGSMSLNSGGGWAIDDQHAVTTVTMWVAGYNLNPFGLVPVGPVLRTFLTRWLPSTATSVSAGKLYAQTVSGRVSGVSPDGTRVAMTYSYFDTLTRKESYFNWNGGGVTSFNNSKLGAATFRTDAGTGLANAAYQPGTWREGTGFQALPQGGFASGGAGVINARADVANWLSDGQWRTHGALWSDGLLQVISAPAGQSADVVGLNDAGQSLVRRWAASCAPSTSGTGYLTCNEGLKQLWLRQPDGSELPIGPPAGMAIGHVQLSAQGAVLGCMQPIEPPDAQTGYWLRPPECIHPASRAFIWADGVMQDLTTVARAKGAKLPTGANLTIVMAINAKGSLVARMVAADGKTVSIVRLTAK